MISNIFGYFILAVFIALIVVMGFPYIIFRPSPSLQYPRRQKKSRQEKSDFWKFDAPVGTEIWRAANEIHRIIKTHAGCWQIQYRANAQEEWHNGNMLHNHEDVELFINSKSI